MTHKILVPVDGSTFAESALPVALTLAARTGAEVRLAMVNQPSELPPGLWAEAFLANHTQYLEGARASTAARSAPDVPVTSVLLEGEVAESLCSEVVGSGADLVVMSTHGYGGLARLWLGSVADAVLRLSTVPVLLVRPDAEARATPTFSRVVVPLDGSGFAETALDRALELARPLGASVTLLRVVSYPMVVGTYLPDNVGLSERLLREAEAEAEAYLERVEARVTGRGVALSHRVFVGPSPAVGVLDFMTESGADLIVISSHNRHGLERVALGSVADKVIRGSKGLVLVVHPTSATPKSHLDHVA